MACADFSFWSHRDRRAEVRLSSALCDCCYCMYAEKPHRALAPLVTTQRNVLKSRFHRKPIKKATPTQQFLVTSYAGQTVGGFSESNVAKTNQDSLVMQEDPQTRSLVLACLDGHGAHGHIISRFFKCNIEGRLFDHPLWENDPKGAISCLLHDLENEICQYSQIDTQFSGTTLVMAVIRGRKLIVANVGDSRALLASSKPTGSRDKSEDLSPTPLSAIPLTVDHKPEDPKELSRVLRAGGRVFSLPEEGISAPQRVWLGNENVPGLAMSRSLCDEIAQSVGVISTPDFFEKELDNYQDCSLVLGTDGLWDYVSNDEVAEIVSTHNEVASGQIVISLISEAKKRWLSASCGQDDITACVATLEGNKRRKLR